MRADDAATQAAAEYLDAQPEAAFTGLTEAELARLQNWNRDNDGDGVVNPTDNCPVANTDQADLDADGQGDACDADIDGDGIPNDVETAFGTNPGAADSDGDGVRDSADDCPKRAGAGADGCPVAAASTTTTNVRRASSTSVSVKRARTRRTLTLRSSGKTTGVAPAGTRDCANGVVAVQVKAKRLTVSNRRVRLRADCTFSSKVTFRRSVRQLRSLRIRASFQGSDGLLPSASRRVAPRK